MRFTVSAAAIAGTSNLAGYVEALVRSIGPGPVDLTGNGNTYSDVVLANARPGHTDRKFTMVEFEFLKQV
jgi:hypothetical protein